jgi:hypothetical protein
MTMICLRINYSYISGSNSVIDSERIEERVRGRSAILSLDPGTAVDRELLGSDISRRHPSMFSCSCIHHLDSQPCALQQHSIITTWLLLSMRLLVLELLLTVIGSNYFMQLYRSSRLLLMQLLLI